MRERQFLSLRPAPMEAPSVRGARHRKVQKARTPPPVLGCQFVLPPLDWPSRGKWSRVESRGYKDRQLGQSYQRVRRWRSVRWPAIERLRVPSELTKECARGSDTLAAGFDPRFASRALAQRVLLP